MAIDGIRIIESIEEFNSLSESWRDLGEQRWGPLVSHDWIAAAARSFHPRTPLHVITVWRNRCLVAVAPLVRGRHRGVPCLEVIGEKALYEPSALPALDREALALLCSAIVDQGQTTVLQRFDVDDQSLPLLRNAAAAVRGRVDIAARSPTRFVTVSRYKAPEETSTLRRKRRKLEAQGFRCETVIPSVAELPQLLEVVTDVEAAGWKGRRRSSLAARSELRGFLAEVTRRFAGTGGVTIFLLRNQQRTIAVRVCLAHGQRLWELKIGYDEDWSKYSPGIVLTAATINHAVISQKSGYEFLGTAEPWQEPWATDTREHCAVVFYPDSLPGKLTFFLDRLAREVGRLKRPKE